MASDWSKLTQLTGGKSFRIERVRLIDDEIAIEGSFDLLPLARLPAEDQAFVAAFVCCHGSIKQMEKWFGVSYPTIKNRLNRVVGMLDFVELEPSPRRAQSAEVLDRLERGEVTVEEALVALKQ